MKLRLAILECDTPLPGVEQIAGKYGDQFTRLFELAAEKEGHELAFTTWNVVEESSFPRLEEHDGIIVSGSKHSAMDSPPWTVALVEFLGHAFASGTKVVGICFGHQVASRALGVPIERNPKGWEVSGTSMALLGTGQQLFGKKELQLQLLQMHMDIVVHAPAGGEIIASNEMCQTQGFYVPHRLLTVQGHPEFRKEVMDIILRYRGEQGILAKDLVTDALARSGIQNDGVDVARGALRFLADTHL